MGFSLGNIFFQAGLDSLSIGGELFSKIKRSAVTVVRLLIVSLSCELLFCEYELIETTPCADAEAVMAKLSDIGDTKPKWERPVNAKSITSKPKDNRFIHLFPILVLYVVLNLI